MNILEIVKSLDNKSEYQGIYLGTTEDRYHCIIVGENLENTVECFRKFYNDNPKMLDLDVDLELVTKEDLEDSKHTSRKTNEFLEVAVFYNLEESNYDSV